MSQTQVQNAKSVRLGSGVFRIDGVNIGLLDNAHVTATRSVVQIVANNGKLPPRSKITEVKLSADLYEINLANFGLIDGAGVSENIPGTLTTVTGEVLRATGTWKVGEVIPLTSRNGDGSMITPDTVRNGTVALDEGADYVVSVANGVTSLVALTTIAINSGGVGGINVDYEYTPNAKISYTYSDILRAIKMGRATFDNADENGKKFSIIIPQGYNTANIDFTFISDDTLDSAMTFPIEFTAFPDENNKMLQIDDEQAV